MVKYKRYSPGLEACLKPNYPKPPYKGRGWNISFKNLREKSKEKFGTYDFRKGKSIPSKHMIIEASSDKKAKEVADLIYACLVIINAADIWGYECEVREIKKDFRVSPDIECAFFSKIQLASIMAAKASHRSKYVYAIHKLYTSFRTLSVPIVELDPYLSLVNLEKPTLKKPFPPSEMVAMAHSIVAAYSAIEELGFSGKRNKKAKNKLLSRLKKDDINTKKPFLWTLRGPKTYLERCRATIKVKDAKWCRRYVRDEEVAIVDAIVDASFLRSKVSAHVFSAKKKKKLIKTLSIYDVTNVQYLARRLILESLGLWGI